VYAQWLVLVPDAADAMLVEARRQQWALACSVAKAQAFLHHEDATREAAGPVYETELSMSPRNFERICAKVDPRGNLYVMYRMLSGESHAGVPVVQRWLEVKDDPSSLAYRTRPSDITP
jgi:hypothetical protein